MPAGGIRSANVVKAVHTNGKSYMQISGTMDCVALGVNCEQSKPGAYDDGGQYDSVGYVNCGKEVCKSSEGRYRRCLPKAGKRQNLPKAGKSRSMPKQKE